MDFKRLKTNICDNIFEAQAKLGFDGRQMSLNYMNSSLNYLLSTSPESTDMAAVLAEFAEYAEKELGKITFKEIKNGFCITIPEAGTEYVHSGYKGSPLIKELVEAVRTHAPLERFFEIFRSFSENVSISEMDNEEFQYLLYYKDGVPDEYRYCISVDEEIDGSVHVSYHRFIKEDYEELGF